MSSTMQQLETFGPDQCRCLPVDEARAWCRRLAGSRYENFSVLTGLVPKALRDDFAAVYAFCRWADDLGDEAGDTERSLELLAWWEGELRRCYAGEQEHPIFVALQPAIEQHDLPMQLFLDLIEAFRRDQTVTRYDTWAEVLDYCRLSANPVGRLVLMLCGSERSDTLFERSDEICTALQLTNHWQDICRDLLDRDRIYLPGELHSIDDFESRLRTSAGQGYAVDQTFLQETRVLIKACCERTWNLYESGAAILPMLSPTARPIVWLLATGGQHVLRQVELWNYETVLHRPKLSRFSRLLLVARAHLMTMRAGSGKAA